MGTNKFSEEPGLSDDDKNALIEFLKPFWDGLCGTPTAITLSSVRVRAAARSRLG
jgi:hypothetical protein